MYGVIRINSLPGHICNFIKSTIVISIHNVHFQCVHQCYINQRLIQRKYIFISAHTKTIYLRHVQYSPYWAKTEAIRYMRYNVFALI